MLELLGKLLLGGLLLAALAALAGLVLQWLATLHDERRFPPLGRRYPVGGRRLHLCAMGEGTPTVILDTGLPGTCLSWWHLQPEVAKFTRVVSYDRAGLGWSDPGPEPRTAERIAAELRQLLAAAEVPGPYVFVGHSFSGFTARLFAARYPDEVAGLVLIDPVYASEWLNLPADDLRRLAAGARLGRRVSHLARLGVMRAYLYLISLGVFRANARGDWVDSFRKLPRGLFPVVRAFWSQPKPYRAVASQVESLPASAAQVAAAVAPPDLPIVVLSAGNTRPERRREQEAIAQQFTDGKHAVIEDSGHWIQLDKPEAVLDAIREVVAAARRRPARPVTIH
jgi:pimeloyl-ACP methyl ester carboxylesterase